MDPRDLITKDVTVQSIRKMVNKELPVTIGSRRAPNNSDVDLNATAYGIKHGATRQQPTKETKGYKRKKLPNERYNIFAAPDNMFGIQNQ